MTLLQTQFVLVFAMAAGCGYLLGRWSMRRSFFSLTESYRKLAKVAESNVPWDMLWARFDTVDDNMRRIVREELDDRMPGGGSLQ